MTAPADRDGFEIAIICALGKERDAVGSAMTVDFQEQGLSYGKADGDRNAYTTGVFGGKPVVVVCLRDMGTLNAATVAGDIRLSFRRLKLALVVGVAGGAPQTPLNQQIRLGDVIISKAVIQYDFGRQYPNSFRRKTGVESTLGRANTELGNFIAKLESQRVLCRLLQKMSQHTLVPRPPEDDVLYHSHYRHKHRPPVSCTICDACHHWYDEICAAAERASCKELGCGLNNGDDGILVRQANAGSVQILFGRIASGNGVIKSGFHRDQLISADHVVGFEMEGAGIWEHLPTIVVKSVCDYADSHKNKNWQMYAAATAAACAAAVIQEWELTDPVPPVSDHNYAKDFSMQPDLSVSKGLKHVLLASRKDDHEEDELDLARDRVAGAYKDSERIFRIPHAAAFATMPLTSVGTAVEEVDLVLASKHQLRALGRLRPLLHALKHFAAGLQPVCDSKEQIEMIWTPVAQCLKLACIHMPALDVLLAAYIELGSVLPAYETVQAACWTDSSKYLCLAVVYECLLDLHGCMYKVLTVEPLSEFFQALWNRFHHRWRLIISTISRVQALLRTTSPGDSVADFLAEQQRNLAQLYVQERSQADGELETVMSWLDTARYRHPELLETMLSQHCPGTSNWFLDHHTVRSWLSDSPDHTTLSVVGKPGSGKSMLCAQLLQVLGRNTDRTTSYHLFSLRSSTAHGIEDVMRSLLAGLVRRNDISTAFVYTQGVITGQLPTKTTLLKLLSQLIAVIGPLRFVVDGLDECHMPVQKEAVKALLSLTARAKRPGLVKVIIFTQEVAALQSVLRLHGILSLDEQTPLRESIRLYVKNELALMSADLDAMDDTGQLITKLEQNITTNARGMFLWVKLVLASLRDEYRVGKLHAILESMPKGIDEAYARLLARIFMDFSDDKLLHASQLFSMLLVTERPLKVHELLDAVTFCSQATINEENRVRRPLLDQLRPLIEISRDATVSLIHFTAKIYLTHELSGPSLTRRRALYNAALSCMTYMHFSLFLADKQTPESSCIDSVVMGFHNLHNFANAHWYSYLEQYAIEIEQRSEAVDQRLQTVIEQFCDRYQALCSRVETMATTEPALRFFAAYTRLWQVAQAIRHAELQQVTAIKHGSASVKEQHQDAERSSPGPEPWTRVSSHHRSLVQQLLAPGSELLFPAHAVIIPSFRARHGWSQFPCRHNHCIRRSCGFATQEALRKHESEHWPRLLCPDLGCHVGRQFGFKTKAQMQKHWQTHHAPPLAKLATARRPGVLQLIEAGLNDSQQGLQLELPEQQAEHNSSSTLQAQPSLMAQHLPSAPTASMLRPQPGNFGQQIFAKIIVDLQKTLGQFNGSWQAALDPRLRANLIMQLTTTLGPLEPKIGKILQIAQRFELNTILESQTRQQYEQLINSKLEEIRQKIAQKVQRNQQIESMNGQDGNLIQAQPASNNVAENDRAPLRPSDIYRHGIS